MLIIRKLHETDCEHLARHLMRLDSYDRRCRFGSVISDAEIQRYCRRTVGKTSTTVAAFRDGEIRASVELQPEAGPRPAVAELAFSVAKDLQEMGLGTALMRRALTVARNIGIKQIIIVSMRQNHKMQKLARRFGGECRIGRDEVVSVIPLSRPTELSFFQEIVDNNCGIIAAAFAPFLEKPGFCLN